MEVTQTQLELTVSRKEYITFVYFLQEMTLSKLPIQPLVFTTKFSYRQEE